MSVRRFVNSKYGSQEGSNEKRFTKSRDFHSVADRNVSKIKRSSKDANSSRLYLGHKGTLPKIIVDDVDVTPLRLDPFVYEAAKERSLVIQEAKESFIMAPQSVYKTDSQRFHTTLLQQRQETTVFTAGPRKSMIVSSFIEDVMPSIGFSAEAALSRISDIENLTEDDLSETEVVTTIPENISLVLTETETIFLLDLPSCTISRNSEETEAVNEDNKRYDYLVKGKGRYRKVLTVGVQTIPILSKVRDTETMKRRYKNRSTYVSVWEMYDTFKKFESEEVTDEEESEQEDFGDEDDDLFLMSDHKLNDETSLESYRLSYEEKQINKLIKSKAFFDALIVIERILGNNTYNEEQKRFKGLYNSDPFAKDQAYKYHLDLLWTYGNDSTEGKCVTALAFNSSNEDIVAVAYGKYYYSDRNCQGMVMIWNFKNPQQPEREYKFMQPVTSIGFATMNPNLIAVGFYNGHIKVLDVSKKELLVLRENLSISFESVWSILWLRQGDEEDIMACFGDGKVCRFQIKGAFKLKCTQIMKTGTAEGLIKGINYLKKCEDKEIPVSRYEEARCLTLHPVDAFTYFVGSSEGVVHRCSTNYYNEHMDLFKSHDGAIHTMKFSPFVNKMFATCGDDFRFRLWVDGIYEPLVTAEPALLPVLDIDWSPTHPTIIATIRGTDVLVWDMQRKMYAPQSQTKCSTSTFNTICRFTPNGCCLMVGDMGGNVRVYCLEDMPITPFFPEHLMYGSLKKLLVTKPNLTAKVKKLGSLNFERNKSLKYFH